jgi:vacuolar-type H+-ATPase subunit E/Vma4
MPEDPTAASDVAEVTLELLQAMVKSAVDNQERRDELYALLEARLNVLEERFASLEARFDAFEERVSDMELRFDRAEGGLVGAR